MTNDGLFKKKCGRCTRQRHACDALEHRQLIPIFNEAVRQLRRKEAEEEDADEDDEPGPAAAAFAEANRQLLEAVRLYHNNKYKMTGEERTPRSQRVAAAPAASIGAAGISAATGQNIARSLRALVEVGRSVSFPLRA